MSPNPVCCEKLGENVTCILPFCELFAHALPIWWQLRSRRVSESILFETDETNTTTSRSDTNVCRHGWLRHQSPISQVLSLSCSLNTIHGLIWVTCLWLSVENWVCSCFTHLFSLSFKDCGCENLLRILKIFSEFRYTALLVLKIVLVSRFDFFCFNGLVKKCRKMVSMSLWI